jgi:hypothetical protein
VSYKARSTSPSLQSSGVYHSNDFAARYKAGESIMAIVTLLAIWLTVVVTAAIAPLLPVPTNMTPREPSWWEIPLALFGLTGISFLISVWAYFARQKAEQYRTVREAARAYLEYLRSHEISVRPEFTQSTRMHEFDRAGAQQALAAAPLAADRVPLRKGEQA